VREVLAASDAGVLRLGGTVREATVLFADIRDFCCLAYGSSPDQVVVTLNTYLAALVEVIDRHEGTVNKFIGDSVMAIWNAPLDQPDHAQRAVSAACEMQQVIRQLGTGPSDVPAISFGIGVNSGEMVAGNVGSRQRMEYTVIGDAVNIASRLCEQARPGQILIGARTFELTGEVVAVQECPLMNARDDRGSLPAYLVVE
jgi:adenylate cyclase